MDYTQERIENWVADFCASDRISGFAAPVKEIAADTLRRFFVHACVEPGIEPEDLTADHLKHALFHELAGLGFPESVRQEIPRLCGSFLEDLEAQGRLAQGRQLGQILRAQRDAFVAAAGGKQKPIVSRSEKLGRNDPCPCGSGKKYKKCCLPLAEP